MSCPNQGHLVAADLERKTMGSIIKWLSGLNRRKWLGGEGSSNLRKVRKGTNEKRGVQSRGPEKKNTGLTSEIFATGKRGEKRGVEKKEGGWGGPESTSSSLAKMGIKGGPSPLSPGAKELN